MKDLASTSRFSARLSDVAETMQGGRLKLSGKHFVEDGFPAYGAGGINGHLGVAEFEKAGIVLSAIGARCGKCFLAEGRWTSLANTRLIFPDSRRVDIRFLWYQLNDEDRWPRSGAAQPFIRPTDVEGHIVYLPPLEEQKRIVAVLDQAFAALDRARAHAEANLADATELLENGVNDVFTEQAATAPVVTLADAVHPDCKLSYGIVQPGDELDRGLPIVRPVDLKQRVITLDGLKRISPDRADGYARTKLVGGELLLCVRGSTGEMSVASSELAGANVTRGIVPVRFPQDQVLPEYAYFQLRSRYAQDQIAAGTYGAALMQINIKDLRNLKFIVPDVETQRAIIVQVEHLYERTERLRSAYAAQVADTDALRQSLLHKAFSGQLT